MARVRPKLYLRTIFENNQNKVVDQDGNEVAHARTIIIRSPHDGVRECQVSFIETNPYGRMIMGNGDIEKPPRPPRSAPTPESMELEGMHFLINRITSVTLAPWWLIPLGVVLSGVLLGWMLAFLERA